MERSRLETVAKFLTSENTLTLATTTAEGAPRAAPLFYLAGEGLRLYWLSSASSEHSRDLELCPQAAVSVYRPAAEWKKIRGVQMRGTVCVVSGRARRGEVLEAYRSRFRLGRLLEPVVRRSTVYCFQPEWIRYIDNSKKFGSRFELLIGDQGGGTLGEEGYRELANKGR
jgi:uncharacterized protein YhbP (UPF0306 family)